MNIYIVRCHVIDRIEGIAYGNHIEQIITATSEENARDAFLQYISSQRPEVTESDISSYIVGEA